MVALITLTSCGRNTTKYGPTPPLPPIDTPLADNTVVHGRAFVTISSEKDDLFSLFIKKLMPSAYAASGSTTVTYTNAASTNFTINVAGLAPTFTPTFTGNTLNLGSVALATLSDNNLKVCNPGGNTKCTSAIIRVYNTGATAGFIQTVDLYAAPVFTGALNPAVALGLNSAGAVQVAVDAIPATQHKENLTDISPTTYAVTSDFSNAGAGAYSMVYVVEYALAP